VTGLVADRHVLLREPWYRLRELAALARAWFDLTLLKPTPVLGDPIPVDWGMRVNRHPLQDAL
jgi:hypothetical protein